MYLENYKMFNMTFLHCSKVGLTEDQIDMSLTWIKAQRKKDGGYNPDVQLIVDALVSVIIY